MSTTMHFFYDSKPIQTIIQQIRRGEMDLQPEYQRGFIWGRDFIDKLWYSIIKGYPIGNISLRVLARKNNKGAMFEVVDGQQRLTSIYNFIIGEHSIQGDIARRIIEDISEVFGEESDQKMDKLKRKLNNKGKIAIKLEDLPTRVQEEINAVNISITNITNSSDEEITEYFRYVQNQERLRAGEIINSIPTSPLEHYLDKINNRESFYSKLGFQNSRKQFDRVFYSILGLLDGKIGFGVLDKDVLKYASDCEALSSETEQKCDLMISQINYVVNDPNIPTNYIKSNMRCMKFFLLTAALNLVDYTKDTNKKLASLGAINDKLSSFNSAKAGKVERTFDNYSTEVIEEHRLLALISKGGQTYNRVCNRMQILAYYINYAENITKPSGIEPI